MKTTHYLNRHILLISLFSVSVGLGACSPFKSFRSSSVGAAAFTPPDDSSGNNGQDTGGSDNTGGDNTGGDGGGDTNNPGDSGSPGGDSPNQVQKTVDLDLSFGQINELTQTHLKTALDNYIRQKNCNSVGDNEYRCGELPFGEIEDFYKKTILTLDIGKISGKEDDLSYTIEGGKIPIYLERHQYRGLMEISDLTTKSVVRHVVSDKLGDDIFLKVNPQGGKLTASLCVGVPGLKGFSKKTDISGTIHKPVPILPDIHIDLDMQVDPGEVETTSLKICSELLIEMDSNNLPMITLLDVSVPQQLCAMHSGLKINVDAQLSGLWSFVNAITKIFRYDLEEIIAGEVKKQVKKIADKEIEVQKEQIEDGRWLGELIRSAYLEKAVTELSQGLRDEMVSQGWLDLMSKEVIQVGCISLLDKFALTPEEKTFVFKACALAPQVKIEVLQDSAIDRNNGCYSHYFSLTQEANPQLWWSSQCRIRNRAVLTVDSHVDNLYSCMSEALNYGMYPHEMCEAEIESFISAINSGALNYLWENSSLSEQLTDGKIERLRNIALERLEMALPNAGELHNLFQ